MTLKTLEEITQAIENLSPADRSRILNRMILQLEHREYRVEEPPMPYVGGLKQSYLSVEEYLEGELHSSVRHEYLAGDIYAMAGTTTAHNRIAGNIFGELYLHLRGKRCEPFMNDMKARIRDKDEEWFYYPDVMVNCDPKGQEKLYCDTPAVIFEVLSPDTERTDKREKRIVYTRVPSLHTYVVVAQERRDVTIYRRKKDWRQEILPRDGMALDIPELEFSPSLDVIYRRTDL